MIFFKVQIQVVNVLAWQNLTSDNHLSLKETPS